MPAVVGTTRMTSTPRLRITQAEARIPHASAQLPDALGRMKESTGSPIKDVEQTVGRPPETRSTGYNHVEKC